MKKNKARIPLPPSKILDPAMQSIVALTPIQKKY